MSSGMMGEARATYSPAPPPEGPVAFGPLRFIPGANGGRYPYCHSLVLEAAETWVVDPASDKEFLGNLARSRRVTRVFLSHFHEDHLKYAGFFPEAAFYVPARELAAFTSLEGVFELVGATSPEFQAHLRETLEVHFHFRPFSHLVPYHPGERFQNGEVVLEVVAAPGHTPGHSCFAFPELDLIFLADVDLSAFGPWYADAASDLEAYHQTLEELKKLRFGTVITAHEQGVFTPEEAQAGLHYFSWVLADREARLLEALKYPHTLQELVQMRLIYRRPRDPLLVYDHMEAQMLKKHLERLRCQGKVVLAQEGYQACL